MNDRSWILNPSAIMAAKKCINIVHEELEVKLKLSHPNFMELLAEYCELTDSAELTKAYFALAAFANGDSESGTVVPLPVAKSAASAIKENQDLPQINEKPVSESVSYKGKTYSRYDEQGAEFKGLYRGSARYA